MSSDEPEVDAAYLRALSDVELSTEVVRRLYAWRRATRERSRRPDMIECYCGGCHRLGCPCYCHEESDARHP